jgi:hypothetical protein
MSSPLGRTFEGFSLSHAAILDGETGAEEVDGDIFGVRTASIAPDTGTYDNTGDDFVLSSWQWINFATVTVESGYVPFSTIALLSGYGDVGTGADRAEASTAPTGEPLVGTGNPNYFEYAATAGADLTYEMSMWDEDSSNQPTKPMLIRVPSKDANGVPRTFDFVLYKVNFSPFTFTGPAYKDGLLLTYTGRAVLSNVDEAGNELAKRAIGRMINRPLV